MKISAVALGAIGYILSAVFASDTTLAIASIAVASIGTMGCLPVFWSLPPTFLRGSAAAAGIALINSLGNLGGIISPYLVGKVVDMTGAPTLGLFVIAGAMLLAAALSLFGLRAHIARASLSAQVDGIVKKTA